MRNSLIALAAVAGLAWSLVGCAGDSCVSRCEQAKENGCVTPSTDCEANCANVQQMEDEGRADAETAGCLTEFEAVVSCTDGLEACASGCETETAALTNCFVEFCTANPSSPVCAAG